MNKEQIEAGAKAVCASRHRHHLVQRDFWSDCGSHEKDQYRDDARAVLETVHPTLQSYKDLIPLPLYSKVLKAGMVWTKVSDFEWQNTFEEVAHDEEITPCILFLIGDGHFHHDLVLDGRY